MGGLLSLLGAVLTVLTAAALVALVASAPQPPAAETGAVEPGAIAPAAGGDGTGEGGLRALGPALLDLALRPQLDWARDLVRRLRPDGIAVEDVRFTLPDGPLGEAVPAVLTRVRLLPAAEGWRARFEGRLEGAPAVPFAGRLELDPEAGGQRLRLFLDEFALGALLLRAAPEAVTSAQARASATLDARLRQGALTDTAVAAIRLLEPGRVRAEGMAAALPVDMLEIGLEWPASADAVRIRRFALTSPALNLAARGEVAAERVRLVIAADAVDVTWAPRLWPEGVADGARDWVTANITAGRIARLDARLELDEDALAADVLPAGALEGEARIDGAEIHYLRPMPPAVGADATARFDGDRLTFAIARGEAQGVAITGGDVVIADYGDPESVERLAVDLEGRGTVPAMLRLTDHEPLTLATRKGLPVATSAGAGRFRLQVGLPLLRDLDLEDVDLDFEGTFDGVRLPGMAGGRDLTDADFRLSADTETVSANGTGRIGGVPLQLSFEAEGARETFVATGRIDAASLVEIGAPALPLDGPVGLDVTLTSTNGTEQTDLRLDVTPTEVNVPALAVWKPAGIEGSIGARIVETRGRTSVENLAVSWPGAEIRGSAELDADERLVALALDPLRLAGTDLRLNGSREGDVLTLRVAGPRLDLAPFLAAEDGGGGGAGDAAGSGLAALAPLRLDLAIDHMVAGGDGALRNVTGGARIDDIGVHDVRLDAGIRPGEGEARLRLEPADEGGERLSLTTDDAGGLLAALALTDALRGGTLELSGDLTSQLPNVRLDGEITARDFVLGGAPPVVRVLAAAPATAELAEDDLAVARFTSPLVIDGDTVRLDDALMIASNLAVRASGEVDLAAERVDIGGSLAPVQGVNRFIGNLPLIGALLQGSSKAGAFALSFSVQGPWADPAVSVNPLSVVTPGLLQDLFAGAEIKPPRIPEDEE